jgi:excinuclease ABC subunit B
MRVAIEETKRRRRIQEAFNKAHGITPQTIVKPVYDVIEATKVIEEKESYKPERTEKLSRREKQLLIQRLEKEMKKAARELHFERAAELRDAILELKAEG